jgi:SAM-dependent methyltransferase
MEQNNCVVCSSVRITREPFFYIWRSKRYWLMRCAECSHQFIFPHLAERDQRQIYDDQYFSKAGNWACGVFDGDYISSEAELRTEGQSILHMLPARSGKLLDVGCAGGYFLDEARKAGFDVTGIELNRSMVDHARTVLGLDVVCRRIEDIPSDNFKADFDVVVMLDVLEHLPHPRVILNKIAEWTHSGSFLLVRGPLHNDIVAKFKEAARRMVGVKKQLPGYPLDVNSFSKKSLVRLLTLGGFKTFAYIDETRQFANVLARRL